MSSNSARIATGCRFAEILVALLVMVVVGQSTIASGDGTVANLISGDKSIGDILEEYGLPLGLVPQIVSGYTLDKNGKFHLTLKSTCTTKFGSEEVYYKKSITGNLSYGKISNLDGIQAHEFFWVSVTEIEMDSNNPNIIWFKVGFLSKSLSTDLFQVAPTCNSLRKEDNESMTFSDWLSKLLVGSLEVKVPTILDEGTARKMLH